MLRVTTDGCADGESGEPVTDEFGTASAELKVPLSTAEDTYTLQVSYGRARESTDLQIRAFEPPALRIEHTLPRMIGPDREFHQNTNYSGRALSGPRTDAKADAALTTCQGRRAAILSAYANYR